MRIAAGSPKSLKVRSNTVKAKSERVEQSPVVDELPVFENLYEEESFRQYARGERYQIAQQAQNQAAGFVF